MHTQGMFGDYAVHALWTDTTTMNTDKAIPYTCHGDLHKYTMNCVHVPTAYGNNDSDNNVSGICFVFVAAGVPARSIALR